GGGGASARVLVCSGGGPPRAGVGGAGPGGRGCPPQQPPARSTWLRGDPSRVLSAARNGGFQFRPIGSCRGSAYVTVRPTGSNQPDASRRTAMTTSTKGTALVTGAYPGIVERDPARNRPLPLSRVSGIGSGAHRRPPHIPLYHQAPLSSQELPMLDTLRHVIEAHGGLENWNKHKALSVDLVVGGMLWGL